MSLTKKLCLDSFVDAAIDEMPEEFRIKEFLVKNRAEVRDLFLTEYDEKKVLEMEREEGREEGREEKAFEVATDLIKEGGMSVSYIAKISKLSEDAVRKLAQSLGMAAL